MNGKLIATLAAVGLALVAVTPATVAEEDHTYNGTITPFWTGYAVTSSHDFIIDLEEGQTVSAALSWDDEVTDLDLVLIRPGGSCGLFPELELQCIIDSAEGRTQCGESPGRQTLGDSPESFTLTAEDTGTHKVVVQAALAVPQQPVDYALTVSVDGSPLTLDEPEPIAYVQTGVHCRAFE